jgi:uncharacterized RDD family membrane protein YckC
MNSAIDTASSLSDPLAGKHAGFWLRFVAGAIDLAIYTPLYIVIRGLFGHNHILMAIIVFDIFAISTYAAFFSSKWHASPGLKLLGIYVVDRQGQFISYGQSLKWGIISAVGFIFCCAGLVYMQYRFDLTGVLQLVRSCKEEQLLLEDCIAEVNNIIDVPFETFTMMLQAASLLTAFLLLVWSLSVALTRDKSGFHNLICNTRFIKGKP